MLIGLDANTAEVAKNGVTAEFSKSGKALLSSVESMEAERQTIKDSLKTKTAALNVAVSQLKTWNSEASRTVKRTYRGQKEKWVEFGIKAKAKAKRKAKRKKK